MTARVLDYGDRALLIECGSTGEVLAVAAALRSADFDEVIDIVPAARTVLVTVAEPRRQAAARRLLEGMPDPEPVHSPPPGAADVVVDVVYDGADLAWVAEHLGMTRDELIGAHTGTPWQVGFTGFAPGFAYLVGGDPRLSVPRRADPRPRVPAGSVALAGEFSGIYPRESPGGWQLIGRTDAVLWDVQRPDPALLTPGMWVRFRDAGPS
ncbi:MAG: allophanate hydrolase subunit 1 [Mycobacterium sp.]